MCARLCGFATRAAVPALSQRDRLDPTLHCIGYAPIRKTDDIYSPVLDGLWRRCVQGQTRSRPGSHSTASHATAGHDADDGERRR